MDVGKSLNPAIDVGQIEGAFVQGYGYMTLEEMLHNNQGEILNKNLSTYKVFYFGHPVSVVTSYMVYHDT